MHTLYNFVSGPLAWIAFLVFIGGCFYKLYNLITLTQQKESFIFSIMSVKYGLRSIGHWLTPFATVNMKNNPVMTVVTFVFHLSLFITPIFLLAHVILWDESFNISWWSLPEQIADILTVVVIAGCCYFLYRRLTDPTVKYLTSISDFILLGIVAAPFLTGFLAYHQLFDYQLMMILHVLSGEIMLVAIPFTRLSHMIYSPFTRAYIGSEFGGVRHAKDW
ncbi:MAG: TmcC1 [Candidatus Magnetoglobus multicellularis str. Araruama]|uniref:TmcC1 n=1 Tax=Candidatus Magnetoglobus multicellularis str. Araruama TaxID=890399 RepID=A0A1V1PAT2_9BACT|nr:MAG: TmcC1 [Candidatus Magnetoglobus multicellularis str. Araruama]